MDKLKKITRFGQIAQPAELFDDDEVIAAILGVPTHFADITITAANVVKGSSATTTSAIAGETITAGQALYLNSSDNKVYKADNDASSTTATCVGIALNGGAAGQPITYQTGGTITIGATVVAGTIYCVSSTAGGICPAADLASGDYTSIIGVATTAAIISMSINNSGAQW
jgi:predicted transcriptional regulator